MLLLWTTVLLYVQLCVFGAPDHLLKRLQSKYKTKPIIGSSDDDVGEPLYLTPFIRKNQTAQAREESLVQSDLFFDKESYSGYFTVNEKYNANLFFWYFPVSGKPVEETPWIIWLQGGLGESSLIGLLEEIGPFTTTASGLDLEEMTYSWGKKHSLLFIDNPVGAGFSFADSERGYANNQATIGENLYNALQQFLEIFPELRKAPLTIAGESYGGKHVTSLGIEIHRHKEMSKPINLQGLAIGNGYIDPAKLYSGYGDFLREVGLVDDRIADEMKKIEAKIINDFKQHKLKQASDDIDELIVTYKVYTRLINDYNYLKDGYEFVNYTRFLDQGKVRKALHVGNVQFDYWNEDVYEILEEDKLNSAKPWLEELLENYKVMLYNGHLDLVVAYRPSVNMYNALNFSGAAEYRAAERRPWLHNSFLYGYYKTGGNLLEVMVRGAGHLVPADKPAAALALISAFALEWPLAQDTGHLVPGAGAEGTKYLVETRTLVRDINHLNEMDMFP